MMYWQTKRARMKGTNDLVPELLVGRRMLTRHQGVQCATLCKGGASDARNHGNLIQEQRWLTSEKLL